MSLRQKGRVSTHEDKKDGYQKSWDVIWKPYIHSYMKKLKERKTRGTQNEQ